MVGIFCISTTYTHIFYLFSQSSSCKDACLPHFPSSYLLSIPVYCIFQHLPPHVESLYSVLFTHFLLLSPPHLLMVAGLSFRVLFEAHHLLYSLVTLQCSMCHCHLHRVCSLATQTRRKFTDRSLNIPSILTLDLSSQSV